MEDLETKLGKEILDYADKYKGTDKYNDVMLAIEFGYHLNETQHTVDTNETITDAEIGEAIIYAIQNLPDEGLFPNHTDKDIYLSGIVSGLEWYREQLKKK